MIDPSAPTQPVPVGDPLGHLQRVRVQRRTPVRQRRRGFSGCCSGALAGFLILFLALAAVYLLFPANTRILLLGVDRAPDGSFTGRTDTIMLLQVNPTIAVMSAILITVTTMTLLVIQRIQQRGATVGG